MFFLGAKVRRNPETENSIYGLFCIPQIWYFCNFASYTYYIIGGNDAKNCKTFGHFKEKRYFCQQKD